MDCYFLLLMCLAHCA